MADAKFIGKRYGIGYDRDSIYLEYEYRGKTYEVMENRAKGNEPLSWQHKNQQAHIDSILDAPKTEGHPIDWDEVWRMLGI